MAIIDSTKTERVPIPHEPGEWVELRRISVRDLRRITKEAEAKGVDLVVVSLAAQIASWSYAVPVSVVSVDDLDPRTWMWVLDEAERVQSGKLSADEKKDETSGLTASSPASAMSTETLPTF